MAKRLNKKLVVLLTLAGYGLVLILAVLMLRQLQHRDPQHYIDRAEECAAREEWQRAAVFYGKAWESESDPMTAVKQGQMFLNMGDVNNALTAWDKVISMSPELIEAHTSKIDVLLLRATMSGGRIRLWEGVRQAAEGLLEVAEGNALAHNAKGRALIRLKTLDEKNEAAGEEALRRAAELAPEVLDYSLDLIRYYIAQEAREQEPGEMDASGEDPARSMQLMRELLERFSTPGPEAAEVRRVYAQMLAGQKKYDEAAQFFEEAMAMAGDDAKTQSDAKLHYASYLSFRWQSDLADGQSPSESDPLFQQAKTLLEECIKAEPDSFDPYLVLGRLYRTVGNSEDAMKVCDVRLAKGFTRKGLEAFEQLYKTFDLMMLASEAALAEGLSTADPDSRSKGLSKAREYVDDALAELPGHPYALSQSGRIKLALGQDRAAMEDLRAADEQYSSVGRVDWGTKALIARLHLELDEPGAAKALLDKEFLRANVDQARNPDFWVLYSRVLFESNEPERALEYVDRALRIDPAHANAVRIRAALLARLDRLTEAVQEFGKLTGDPVAQALIEAERLRQESDMEGVISVLRTALSAAPADRRLLEPTVRILVSQGDIATARELVEQALELEPEALDLQKMHLVTRDLSAEQRDQAWQALLESDPDAYSRALGLVDYHYRKEELPRALKWLDKAEQELIAGKTAQARRAGKAGHRALLTRKLLVAARLDNEEAMRAALDSAEKYDVDGTGGKTVLGQYHMFKEVGDHPALAIAAFTEALAVHPTDSHTLSYLGRCYQHIKQYDEAQACFERAIESNPNEGLAYKGLAQLADRRGDEQAREKYLSECERLLPNDGWVKSELALRQERQHPEVAILRRESALAEKPEDTENLRRLADLYQKVSDWDKAEQTYVRLLELEPDNFVWIMSASNFYNQIGKHEKALKLLTDFAETRPTVEDQANAHITIAAHFFRLNNPAMVEETLREAADVAETFEVTRSLADFYFRANMPRRALPWYDRAINRARLIKSPRLPQTLSARIGCLLHQGSNDTDMARKRIEEFRRNYPEDPRGLYWTAELHARLGEFDRAIAVMSEYLEKRPDNAYALYLRAEYRLNTGDLAQAIADLEAFKERYPAALSLEPRIRLARAYEQAGQRNRMLQELQALVASYPDSDVAAYELVDALIEEERFGDAEEILTTRINRGGDNPNPKLLFKRGNISIRLNAHDRALADYKRAVELGRFAAEYVGEILQVFLDLNRAEEGIRYFQEHRGKISPTSMVTARYAALLGRAGRKTEAVKQFRSATQLAIQERSGQAKAVYQVLAAVLPRNEALELFGAQPAAPAYVRANDWIMVELLSAARKTDEALQRLGRLKETATSDRERAELFAKQADVYQIIGDYQAAAKAYEDSLRYDDRNLVALNNLAYVLSDHLGEPQLGLPYARQAAEVDPGNPAVIDTLGWIQVQLGQYQKAIGQLVRAREAAPGLVVVHYHLGEAYRCNGQFREAHSVLSTGIRIASIRKDVATGDLMAAALEKVNQRDSTP